MTDPNPNPDTFTFERRISIGNILSIAVLVAGMSASWYALKQEQALQTERAGQSIETMKSFATENRVRIEKVEASRDDMRERLIRLEIGQEAQSKILIEVLAELRKGRL